MDTLIHTFSTFGCICTHLLICVYTHVDSVWVFDNGCIHSHLWIWLHKSIHQAHTYLLLTVHAMSCCYLSFSFPRPGQNLWFTYRSQKDLDGLLKSLHPQGIRESWLKAEIKKRYDDISRAIIQVCAYF